MTGQAYPDGGYGFVFDKGVHFRYWGTDGDSLEEFDNKSESAEQIFNLSEVCAAAGVDYGADDCEAFVKLLFSEMGIGGCAA